MRPPLLLLAPLLAAPALAQPPLEADPPESLEAVRLSHDAALTLHLRGLEAAALVLDSHENVIGTADCDDVQRLTPVDLDGDGGVVGAEIARAYVTVERVGGRRDTVRLEATCLFAGGLEAADRHAPVVQTHPVRAPLAGGWRITNGHGDGDGYAGDWVVGRAWEAHRTGAPAPFLEADAPMPPERLRTELVLLAEGARAQRAALAGCAEAPTAACVEAHDAWLGALVRWAEFAASLEAGLPAD